MQKTKTKKLSCRLCLTLDFFALRGFLKFVLNQKKKKKLLLEVFRQQLKQKMIAICIFSVLIQTIFCAECDGEVTTCSSCTSSSETFAQCQWCSSNGNCNGKFDVASNCPNGGQWLYDCATGSCSAFETTNIEATRSHQCNTSTTDQCVTTSCAVFVAKITRLSAACIQFQQTACKTFVRFSFSFGVISLLISFLSKGMF